MVPNLARKEATEAENQYRVAVADLKTLHDH